MEDILINGKENNLAVDLDEPIKIEWSKLATGYLGYLLEIYQEDRLIHKIASQGTEVFYYVQLRNNFQERKKFRVKLCLYSGENGSVKEQFKTFFYSANPNLTHSSWITRLDNPIEKEVTNYRKRVGFSFETNLDVGNLADDILLDISGIGYYEVYINGRKINDYFLNSDVTNYSKVVYYDTFKINKFLTSGSNLIQVSLGNGWFNPAPLKLLGKYNMRNYLAIGKPMMICQITQLSQDEANYLLQSDKLWHSKTTNLVFDNLYIGETRDFSEKNKMVTDQLSSRKVDLTTVEVPGPGGKLVPSFIEKIKREEPCTPKKNVRQGEKYLIDFGKIISGQIRLQVSSPDKEIYLKYAEKLTEFGDLDFSTTTTSTYGVDDNELGISNDDPVIQEDLLMTGQGVSVFENHFSYHSFRYVSVYEKNGKSFEFDDISAFPTYTNMDQVISFNSSNEGLNSLFQAHIQTKKNNIHSYYEDCARERLGYGGDIVALLESQILTFNSENMLRKVLYDFINDQTEIGGITQTAPYMGIQTYGPSNRAGSLGWQLVLPEIVIKYMKYYGSQILTKPVIDSLKKHVDYLLSFDFDYIKQCCLGDWGALDTKLIEGKETPPDREFCSAAMYLIMLRKYQLLAPKIGLTKEKVTFLTETVMDTERKIIAEFRNEHGTFQSGSQSSYLFALKAEIVDSVEVFKKSLVNKIESEDNIFKFGIFGMAWSYEILNDYPDVIYKWLQRKTYPGFQKMIQENGGVLSEYFQPLPGSSLNHAMFSSYGSWFVSDLLGLKFSEAVEQSKHLFFSPFIPNDVDFLEGSFESVHGLISVKWNRKETKSNCVLTVPDAITTSFSENICINKKRKEMNRRVYLLSVK